MGLGRLGWRFCAVCLVVFGVEGAGGDGGVDDYEVVSWTMYAGTGTYTGNEPGIGEADLGVYSELLGLDAGQRELMRLAHDEYVAAYRGVWLRWAEATADFEAVERAERVGRERPGRVTVSGMGRDGVDEAFYAERASLRESFHRDVRLVLRDAQAASWERVERYLRRGRFFGERRSFGPGAAPEGLIDALGALREVRLEVGEEGVLEPLGDGGEAVVRSFEARLDGLIGAFLSARRELADAVGAYRGDRADGERGSIDDVKAAALRLDGLRLEWAGATARFVREVGASVPEGLGAAFGERMAELGASGGAARAGLVSDRRTRFERTMEAAGDLTRSQEAEAAAIDAVRRERRGEVLEAFAPIVRRMREERGSGGSGIADEISVTYANGALVLRPVEADGDDEAGAEDRAEDADERRRLALRLAEIEQEAIDALRVVLTEEQRLRVVE